MRRVLVEDLQLTLGEFASKIGFQFPCDCVVQSIDYDSQTNTLIIRTDKPVKLTKDLYRSLEDYFETSIVFQSIASNDYIDLDVLRKELNGSFPYVQSAIVQQQKVILKVSGEFGKDRINSKMGQVKQVVSHLLGKDLEIEVQVEEPKVLLEEPKVIVKKQEQKKKVRKTNQYHTPSDLPEDTDNVKIAGQIFKMELREGKKRFVT
ncbi:MAG TPA: PolC-type DNA polymerase III, partial [Pseudothermotoga sp.]